MSEENTLGVNSEQNSESIEFAGQILSSSSSSTPSYISHNLALMTAEKGSQTSVIDSFNLLGLLNTDDKLHR